MKMQPWHQRVLVAVAAAAIFLAASNEGQQAETRQAHASAPPMPYSYLGRYVEDGKQVILLVRSERIYTVSEGEVLENTYRVERLMRGWLEMTYLPLNIKQTIGTGET